MQNHVYFKKVVIAASCARRHNVDSYICQPKTGIEFRSA
jgi:hypothetical protein